MRTITQEEFNKLFQAGEKNFSDCKFENVEIRQKDFSGCNISGCSFRNSEFLDCQFVVVKGEKIDFSGIKFINSPHMESGFYGFELTDVNVTDAKFRCHFDGGAFNGGNFENVDFSNGEGGCQFTEIDLKNIAFNNCEMAGTKFTECNMVNVDIQNCDMKGIRFYTADIEPGQGIDSCKFETVNLRYAAFHTYIRNTQMIEGDCRNSDFGNCCINLKAQDTVFDYGNFDKVVMESDLQNCDFSDAYFEQADIRHTSFRECELKRIDFLNASMDSVHFIKVLPEGIKNADTIRITMGGATKEDVENHKRQVLNDLRGVRKEPEKSSAEKPLEQADTQKFSPSLSGNIVKKINIMKNDGKPMRICPNGQVYIDLDHLKYFKKDELREIQNYYEEKHGKTFRADPSVFTLPEKLNQKLLLMEMDGWNLIKMSDGRVKLPIPQLRFFTNDEIQVLNSYFMNQEKELKPRWQEYPFSESINARLRVLDEKGTPMHVYPNGQVLIPVNELKHFNASELKEINQYYIKRKNFKHDPTVKKLPDTLVEKLKAMERETGKKIVVGKTGGATLPPSELPHFTDQEVSTLNSYFINRTEKVLELQSPVQ